MTKTLLLSALLSGFSIFGQKDSSEKLESRFVTVNPAIIVTNTTGVNFGILDDYQNQRINGINLQFNPISLIYLLSPKAIEVPHEGSESVTMNGLHISTGGMMDGKRLNGIGLSMYHIAQETNGITLNGFNNNSGKLNGIHVSMLNNSAETGNGILISMSNTAEKFSGLQIGVVNENDNGSGLQIGFYNKTSKLKGVQIGVMNRNKNRRGFQLGLLNKNAKRTLPIFNF